jgi:hypothetical protein
MATPKQIRDRAEHYRDLAIRITDDQTRQGLTRLASGLEEKADQLEAQMKQQDPVE